MMKLLSSFFNWRKSLQGLVTAFVVLVLTLGMLATPAFATSVFEIPTLEAGDPTWIIDKGEVLSRSTEGSITSQLENLAQQTGRELRFVTFRRLDYGETPQMFADKLFEQWFPSETSQANQIVLVLDTVTNGAALRAGEGVKSLLTDDIAQSVAGETLPAPLRQGDRYNEAILAASERLIAVLSGQPDPGPPQIVDTTQVEGTFKKAEETDAGNATVIVVVLLVLATVIPMVTYFWYQGFSN